MASASTRPSLLSLPAELRINIYERVLRPEEPLKLVFAADTPAPSAFSLLSLAPRTFGDPSTNEWLIFTRKFPPITLTLPWNERDGHGEQFNLRVHRSRRPDVALLKVNRQLYNEVLPILWKSVHLDFTQAFSAIIPFTNMLSPLARDNLNNLILRAPLHNTPDRNSWDLTCSYISSRLNLQSLTVEYRYRSGTHWTTEQWHRKLALDPQTRRPSDPAVRAALEFGPDALMSWEDVVQFDEDDQNPKDIEFLEGLPIETEEEMRESLGLDCNKKELLDSSLAALSKIGGLQELNLKLVSGALTPAISAELDAFLKARMFSKKVLEPPAMQVPLETSLCFG